MSIAQVSNIALQIAIAAHDEKNILKVPACGYKVWCTTTYTWWVAKIQKSDIPFGASEYNGQRTSVWKSFWDGMPHNWKSASQEC